MDLKALIKRAQSAKDRDSAQLTALSEAQRYFSPWRQSVSDGRTMDEMGLIFEGAGMMSAMRAAGRLQSTAIPPFERFAMVEPGPMLKATLDKDQLRQIEDQLAPLNITMDAIFGTPAFMTAGLELCQDLLGGQGAMLVEKGDSSDLVRFQVAPAAEVHLEHDARGKIVAVHWLREVRNAEIIATWPDAIDKARAEKMQADQIGRSELQTSSIRAKDRSWRTLTMLRPNPPVLLEDSTSRTCPWVVPRFFAKPGEGRGVGPMQLALPAMRTANAMKKLTLLAAALQIMGVWIYKDDGVFNPDIAKIEPGARWPVASVGGPWGDTVKRLEVVGPYDLTAMSLTNEIAQVREALLDTPLPPEGGAVRSPTEILERAKRNLEQWSGATSRLSAELAMPLAERVLEILMEQEKAPWQAIDGMIQSIRVTSPLATANRSQKLNGLVEFLELVMALLGQEVTIATIKVEEIAEEMARLMDIDRALVRSASDRDQLMGLAGQAVAGQQAGPDMAGPDMVMAA